MAVQIALDTVSLTPRGLAGDLDDLEDRHGLDMALGSSTRSRPIERDHAEEALAALDGSHPARSKSRSRAGAATGIGRRVRRTTERFRAWAAKRVRWLTFIQQREC